MTSFPDHPLLVLISARELEAIAQAVRTANTEGSVTSLQAAAGLLSKRLRSSAESEDWPVAQDSATVVDAAAMRAARAAADSWGDTLVEALTGAGWRDEPPLTPRQMVDKVVAAATQYSRNAARHSVVAVRTCAWEAALRIAPYAPVEDHPLNTRLAEFVQSHRAEMLQSLDHAQILLWALQILFVVVVGHELALADAAHHLLAGAVSAGIHEFEHLTHSLDFRIDWGLS